MDSMWDIDLPRCRPGMTWPRFCSFGSETSNRINPMPRLRPEPRLPPSILLDPFALPGFRLVKQPGGSVSREIYEIFSRTLRAASRHPNPVRTLDVLSESLAKFSLPNELLLLLADYVPDVFCPHCTRLHAIETRACKSCFSTLFTCCTAPNGTHRICMRCVCDTCDVCGVSMCDDCLRDAGRHVGLGGGTFGTFFPACGNCSKLMCPKCERPDGGMVFCPECDNSDMVNEEDEIEIDGADELIDMILYENYGTSYMDWGYVEGDEYDPETYYEGYVQYM